MDDIIQTVTKNNLHLLKSEIADKLIAEYPEIKQNYNRETLRKKISRFIKNQNLKTEVKEKVIDIEKTIEEDKRLISIKKDHSSLNQKYILAVDKINKLENLLDFKKVVDTETIKTINFNTKNKKSSINEGIAITLFSDIHFEERVDKKSINGLNEFTPEIAEQRCKNYFKNLRKQIEKERRDIEINDLIFASLGDMIHGLIHEEYIATNYLRPIEASFRMYEIVLNGLNYLLEDKQLKNIVFIGKIGNHSRTTLRPFSSIEAVMSNEWSIYKHLEKHFENEKRITFILDESYFTYMKVYDKILRFHHGHNIKYMGGIGGLTIPLIKYIYKSNMQKHADMDFIGHFHTRFNLPNCLVNGSIVGFNSYGIKIGASPEEPVQQFQILDATRGFTTNTPILTTE